MQIIKTKDNKNKVVNCMIVDERVDIKENIILGLSKEILEIFLIDKTTNKNIIRATDNYRKNGKGYGTKDKLQLKKY